MGRRTVFFVSDQTGVTAETMGHSLLTQFDGLEFRQVTVPFISTVDKAEEAVRRINSTASEDGLRPIVFSTLVREDVRGVLRRSMISPKQTRSAMQRKSPHRRAFGQPETAAAGPLLKSRELGVCC